jgi:hypothetical protein
MTNEASSDAKTNVGNINGLSCPAEPEFEQWLLLIRPGIASVMSVIMETRATALACIVFTLIRPRAALWLLIKPLWLLHSWFA